MLGVDKNSDADTIKKAYRKLAMQYHPDRNPGDKEAEEKFKEINEAYEVLSDSDKKARYDQFGHAGVDPNMGTGGSGFEGCQGGDYSDIFGDIFNMFGGGFGGQSYSRNTSQKGGDIRVDMTLTFEEAAFGIEKKIKLNRRERCSECDGTGAKHGTSKKTCDKCGGSGQIRVSQKSILGMMQTVRQCDKCGGTGEIVTDPCSKCDGTGYEKNARTINVKIPAGVDSGSVLPLRGEGHAGSNGGRNGDVFIYITVKEHEFFEREDSDIYLTVPISFIDATLGTEIKIPTLDGKVKLKIPEGTQTGTVFKIKGKGIANLNGFGKGNQYVTVVVDIPKKLNMKQKDALRNFENVTTSNTFDNVDSFWKKVK